MSSPQYFIKLLSTNYFNIYYDALYVICLGLESGVKLGLWGSFVALSLTFIMLAWGHFVGAEAVTFCLFLIISLAAVFSVIVVVRTTAKKVKQD
ncbi:MAG: hypothetical protein ACQCN6_14370 [Candidatus Bathyarchaeia archaeon]|jgi:hypothetical protein